MTMYPSTRAERSHDLTTPGAMGKRALLLSFAFWTLVGAFQASNWLLSPFGSRFPDPWRVIASAMFNAYVWALLTPVIFRLRVRLNPERGTRLRRVPIIVAVGLGVAAVVTAMAAVVHGSLVPAPSGRRPLEFSAWVGVWHMGRWYAQHVVSFFGIFVAAIAVDMTRRFHAREREAAQLHADASQLQAERAELRARSARLQAQSAALQAQLSEARLTVLRTRLNPHFLFNTLNAVSALVAKNPHGVRDMIALLSELLRHALAESTEQEIPLRDELRLLRLYLEILEIRYQGQLHIVVTADADVQDALVPNLILQPLVENAMKHGIDRAGGHGTIAVLVHQSGDDLVLTVRDTGPGDGSGPALGASGVGLGLTRARLAELYGDAQRLELVPAAGGGMTARVTLPYHTRDEVRLAADPVATDHAELVRP